MNLVKLVLKIALVDNVYHVIETILFVQYHNDHQQKDLFQRKIKIDNQNQIFRLLKMFACIIPRCPLQ